MAPISGSQGEGVGAVYIHCYSIGPRISQVWRICQCNSSCQVILIQRYLMVGTVLHQWMVPVNIGAVEVIARTSAVRLQATRTVRGHCVPRAPQ